MLRIFVRHLTTILFLTGLLGCAALGPRESRIEPAAKAPKPPAEYLAAGDNAYRNGKHGDALVEYVKALIEAPDNIDVLLRVARVHYEVGEREVAEDVYRKVLTLSPDQPEALEGLGLTLLNQGRHDEAQTVLQRAVDLQPDRWRALNSLGIIADLAGDFELAKGYYARGLGVNPGSAKLLNNLGYSYYLAGDFESAKRQFQKALGAGGEKDKAWSNLGLVQIREAQYRQATLTLENIMDTADALHHVGYVCMRLQRYGCAREHFVRAIAASPVYFEQAHADLARLGTRGEGDSP